MPSESREGSAEFHRRRAHAERVAATKASDERARLAHLELASRHEAALQKIS